MIRFLLFLTLVAGLALGATAQQKFEPGDPIASIDGEPVYLGELNLILVDRLRIRDLDQAPLDVQRAAAMILVRQHLALRSLRRQGGDPLDAMINRQIEAFASDAKRRGSSLEQHAKQRKSDEVSLRADMTWRFAWAQYLKSRLTDKTLRSYYARNRDKYAGGRWDVSQIFVKMDPKNDTSVGVAESRMNEIVGELRKASSLEPAFAAAAREHSDAGSSPAGGKIGWVEGNEDLPSIVMQAVRTAKIGDLTGPIRSPLGLHLILVHQFDRKDVPFEELTDLAQLRRDAADALFNMLLREQKDAKVSWYIGALKPPANISIIPK